MGVFADTTRELYARIIPPFLNRKYPPEGKQKKPLANLTYLGHLVYIHRARHGLTVFAFSSEVGVQASQALNRGDEDQEADQNTFYNCLYLECR